MFSNRFRLTFLAVLFCAHAPSFSQEEPAQVEEIQMAEDFAPEQEVIEEKPKYLFSSDSIRGAGGAIFVADALSISPQLSHQVAYGGNFFFAFDDFLRMGVFGGLIQSVQSQSEEATNGFFLGAMTAGVFRFRPLILGISGGLGFGRLKNVPSFLLNPEISLGVHVTKEFAISLTANYPIFLNGEALESAEKFMQYAVPVFGLRLEFGAV